MRIRILKMEDPDTNSVGNLGWNKIKCTPHFRKLHRYRYRKYERKEKKKSDVQYCSCGIIIMLKNIKCLAIQKLTSMSCYGYEDTALIPVPYAPYHTILYIFQVFQTFYPKSFCDCLCRCFRAEGSQVQEEKGLYRVHQFTKVFIESWIFHTYLRLKHSELLFDPILELTPQTSRMVYGTYLPTVYFVSFPGSEIF